MKTTRFIFGLAVLVLVSALGCEGDGDQGRKLGDEFTKLQIEEGGFCKGPNPCWWRTVVELPNVIRIEQSNFSMANMIDQSELAGLRRILNKPIFRETLLASKEARICKDVFDADLTIRLKTPLDEIYQPLAGRCAFGDDDFSKHPFREMYSFLDGLRRRKFPGVLP